MAMPGDEIEFRLLGKVGATIGGRPIRLGAPLDQVTLVALLLAPQGALTAGELSGRLWMEPPETAPDLVRDYVKKLRRHLDAAAPKASRLLPRYDGCYRMRTARHRVDVHRFLDISKEARRRVADDRVGAASLYREALAEWPSDASGPWGTEPLAALPGAWAETERTRLRNRHREIFMACAKLEIQLGGHEQRLIPELNRLLDVAPLDEGAAELLMLALVQAGRRADALEVFRLTRQRLLDELGQGTGPALARTHQRVLAEDPALTDPQTVPLGAPMPPTAHDDKDRPGCDAEHELAGTAARLVAEASGSGDTDSPGKVLIGTLRRRFAQDTEAEAALAWLVDSPADATALAALEGILLATIVRDAVFAAELRTLVAPARETDERRSVSIHATSINRSNVFSDRVHVSGDFTIN